MEIKCLVQAPIYLHCTCVCVKYLVRLLLFHVSSWKLDHSLRQHPQLCTSMDVQWRKSDSSQKLKKVWALQLSILLKEHVSITFSYLNWCSSLTLMQIHWSSVYGALFNICSLFYLLRWQYFMWQTLGSHQGDLKDIFYYIESKIFFKAVRKESTYLYNDIVI